MRSPRYPIALLAILLWMVPQASAGLPDMGARDSASVRIEVVPASEGRMAVDAENAATALFTIVNATSEPQRLMPKVNLPSGWQLLFPPDTLTVGPNSRHIHLVGFYVPGRTTAGQYDVMLDVQSLDDPSAQAMGKLSVSVEPAYRLSAELMEAPKYVQAGQPYQARFLVTNEGNVQVTASLSLYSSARLHAQPDASRLTLGAGESREVVVQVVTEKTPGKIGHILRLDVALEQAPHVTDQASARVDVVPASGARNPGAFFPVNVSVAAVGDERGGSAQVSLDGKGELFGGQVDLRVVTPDRRRFSTYASRSEYALSYKGKHVSLDAGDQVYALTPLTEYGNYGFGAGLEVSAGRFGLGSYFQKSRFQFPRESQQAVYLRYDPNGFTSLSANLLQRQGYHQGKVVSLRGLIEPGTALSIDAECGAGGPVDFSDYGCASSVAGRLSRASYSVRYVYAGQDFPGYYRDLNAISGSLVVQPTSWFRLEGAWNDQAQGYAAELERLNRQMRVGTTVSGRMFGQSTFVNAYYSRRELDRDITLTTFDRREDAVQVRAGYNARHTGITASAMLGRAVSSAAEGEFEEYRVQGWASPRSGFRAGASLEYYSGMLYFRDQQRWRLNTNLGLVVRKNTSVQLNVSNSFNRKVSNSQYHILRARLEHVLPSGHRLQLVGHQSIFGSRDVFTAASDYALIYTLPVNVPSPRKADMPRIHGRVIEAQTGSGIRNALVYLGDEMVLTGPDGRFSMPAPASGVHYLHVDPLSIGKDRVTVAEMPLAIDVSENGATPIDIVVSPAVALSGQVCLPSEEATCLGLKDAVLEVRSDDRRYRTRTDTGGNFMFPRLAPGKWTLRIINAPLPPHHVIEQESYPLDLRPGERRELRVQVLQKQRTLRLLDDGELSLGGVRSGSD